LFAALLSAVSLLVGTADAVQSAQLDTLNLSYSALVAATGALIYDACKKQGLGRELPSEWFGADLTEWMDKGFMPSP
jgi:hypothetical protein